MNIHAPTAPLLGFAPRYLAKACGLWIAVALGLGSTRVQAQNLTAGTGDIKVNVSLNSNVELLSLDGAVGFLVNPILNPLLNPLNNALSTNTGATIPGVNHLRQSMPDVHSVSGTAIGLGYNLPTSRVVTTGVFGYSLASNAPLGLADGSVSASSRLDNLNLTLCDLIPLRVTADVIEVNVTASGSPGNLSSLGTSFNTLGVDVILGGVSLASLGLTVNTDFELSTAVGLDLEGVTNGLLGILSGISDDLGVANVRLSGSIRLVTNDLITDTDGMDYLTLEGTGLALFLDNVGVRAELELDTLLLGKVKVGDINTSLGGSVEAVNSYVSFEPVPVPEPSSALLVVCSTLLLGLNRRAAKGRKH